MPLLLILLMGLVDVGRILNLQITLTEAAREGARAAALGFDPQERVDRFAGSLSPEVTAGPACEDGDLSGDATITLRSRYEPLLAEPFALIPGWDGALPLEAIGVMPCVG